VTDLPVDAGDNVPGRLGVTARFVDGRLLIDLTPVAATTHLGCVRTSVVSFVVDAAAGITLDTDPDMWTLTTDMTVRTLARPAPARVTGAATIVRDGRRSGSCIVDLVDERDEPFGFGAIGFARVPRRPGDPPKPILPPERAPDVLGMLPTITEPLPDAAGVRIVDAAAGVVEIDVVPRVRNPAGTLQGAIVALVAECAVEELVAHRIGGPVVVTDLDLRYLAQAPVGPVRTSCRVLGDRADAPVEVTLVDTSVDRVTTVVHARATTV
jgi:acyl-coenzyme A thioesterase PaaI-like protein